MHAGPRRLGPRNALFLLDDVTSLAYLAWLARRPSAPPSSQPPRPHSSGEQRSSCSSLDHSGAAGAIQWEHTLLTVLVMCYQFYSVTNDSGSAVTR